MATSHDDAESNFEPDDTLAGLQDDANTEWHSSRVPASVSYWPATTLSYDCNTTFLFLYLVIPVSPNITGGSGVS